MIIPLSIVAAIVTAALAGLGFLGKRSISALDAMTLTQQQIAAHLIEDRAVAKSRHDSVMEALKGIAEALGLSKRVDELEALVRGQGSAATVPTSRSGGSAGRGSRPGR